MNINDFIFQVEFCPEGFEAEEVADAICLALGGNTSSPLDSEVFDKWEIFDPEGFVWSITNNYSNYTSCNTKPGLLSPYQNVMQLENLNLVLQAIQRLGCRIKSSPELIIRFQKNSFPIESLKSMIFIFYKYHNLILQALNLDPNEDHYGFLKSPDSFIKSLINKKATTLLDLEEVWFEGEPKENRYQDWHPCYFQLLNLNPVFRGGSLEFRAPLKTYWKREITSYIFLYLSLIQKSLESSPIWIERNIFSPVPHEKNLKWFLQDLGLFDLGLEEIGNFLINQS